MIRVWLVFLLMMPLFADASGARLGVAVLVPSEEFRERFEEALLQSLGDDVVFTSPARASLLLSVGTEPFERALSYGKPTIGLMVPRARALQYYAEGCGCTAFFAEADPRLQLQLLQRLFPGARRVGLLTGPESGWIGGYLRPHVAGLGLSLEHRELKAMPSDNHLGRQLSALLPETDVLLAVDDSALFSASTARLVLLTSYRQDKPVIGPSEGFVRAGSVASLFYSGQDMVRQAVSAIQDYQASGRFPSPDYGRYFSVAVNEHVARTYDAAVSDAEQLRQELGGVP